MRPEPTFDADGYPIDETLETLKNWSDDLRAAFEYLRKAWKYHDRIGPTTADEDEIAAHLLKNPYRAREGYELWYVSTGGWSGNESLIAALNENYVIWTMTYQANLSGGHYWFSVPADALSVQDASTTSDETERGSLACCEVQ